MAQLSAENIEFRVNYNNYYYWLKSDHLIACVQLQTASSDYVRYQGRKESKPSNSDANLTSCTIISRLIAFEEKCQRMYEETFKNAEKYTREAKRQELHFGNPPLSRVQIRAYTMNEESKETLQNPEKDFREEKRQEWNFLKPPLPSIWGMTYKMNEESIPALNEESIYSPANPDDEFKESNLREDHLDFPSWRVFKKDGNENFFRRSGSTTRSGKLGAEETTFRSKRAAKYEGVPKLVSSWGTSFAAIGQQLLLFFTAGALLLMPSTGVEGALTSIPVNSLFVIGQSAHMNCATDLNRPVYWARTPPGSDVIQWLYYGKDGFNDINVDGRFSIDMDEASGRYDIVIAEVQLKDAGKYICIDESGTGVEASAELVVSDPINCRSSIPSDGLMGYNVFGIDQDFIQFSCSLTFTGNLSPTLEWSWPGSEVESHDHVVTAAKSSVTSTLKLSPTKDHNNVTFQFKARIEGATHNIMNSGHLWESEAVNVKYAEFKSKEVDLCPGFKWNLICNPQCSYDFERKDDDCECVYTYYDTRTQQQYQVTSYAVKWGEDKHSIRVALIVVVSMFACILIFVLIFCLMKKRIKRKPADDLTESAKDRIRTLL